MSSTKERCPGTGNRAAYRVEGATVSGTYAVCSVPRIGETFGAEQRYELLKMLGSGGTARVYLIRDRLLERNVAGKFVDEAHASGATLAEARAIARLKHENIVSVYDFGSLRGTPYILMEYVDGAPLSDVIAEQRLSATTALRIVIEVLRGLEHAHAAGVLHLDLKPSNVILQRDGTAKVVDFGTGSLKMRCGGPEASDDDLEAPVVGTPLYMAPEQWSMQRLDERTDVWAAGNLLYELLTGSPSSADSVPSFRVVIGPWRRAPALSARLGLPAQLDVALSRALALHPHDRFQSAAEFLSALERLELPPATKNTKGSVTAVAEATTS